MKFHPLSSYEGRITHLLLTMPPVPEDYVKKYHQEIDEYFGNRPEKTLVIKFKEYESPKHPMNETRQTNHSTEISRLQDDDLKEIGERIVVETNGQKQFLQVMTAGPIEALQNGRTISNSQWAQDPFSVLRNDIGQAVFLQPMYSRSYSEYSDKFISFQLAMDQKLDLDMLIRPTELLIEGGNVLSGDNFILAGKDMLAFNCLWKMNERGDEKLKQGDLQQIEELVRSAYGVDHIVWVGYKDLRTDWQAPDAFSFQPAFHIDLFVTMGGKDAEGRDILLIGDPQLAIEVIQERYDPKELRMNELALQNFQALNPFWEALESMEEGGQKRFRIIRIPLLIYKNALFSFNNSLTESWEGHKQIFLPDYVTKKELDDENLNGILSLLKEKTEEILCSPPCNFTLVKWIGPGIYFRRLVGQRGSLHCITKVLKRET